MKKIKNYCLLTIMLLSVTFAFAQKGQNRNNGQSLLQFKTELNLSDNQITQLEQLQLESRNELKSLKEDTALSQEEKKAKMIELRSSQKSTYDNILTEEQKNKLKSIKAEYQQVRKAEMAEKKELYKEKRSELKSLRSEFDSKISDADKKSIERLKTVFKGSKKEMKLGQRESRGERPSKEEMEAKRADIKAKKDKFKSEHAGELAELKSLNEKYKEEIKSFLSEKGFNEGKEEMKQNQKGERNARRKHQMKNQQKHRNMARGFLLMDFNETNDAKQSSKKSELKIFPNPSNGITNIEYEVRAKGNVTVQIKDESGKVIKTLVNDVAEVGKYNLEVNTAELQNNRYFIVVTDSQGVTTKKLITFK